MGKHWTPLRDHHDFFGGQFDSKFDGIPSSLDERRNRGTCEAIIAISRNIN
jgi:hypothetical protein